MEIEIKRKFISTAEYEWRWSVKSSNNEIIGASTEGFTSKQACIENLKLLIEALNTVSDYSKIRVISTIVGRKTK